MAKSPGILSADGSQYATLTGGDGSVAGVTLDGALNVNTPPYPQFFDAFSTTLDTTTNWTAYNSTGTSATALGALSIASSTTASAWGGVTSKQAWAPSGGGSQSFGVLATFPNSTIANSTRVFGVFTPPGTPTIAVPVTDGYVFRLDGTGKLFAEVWAAGVSVSSTDITTKAKPTDGVPGIYAITFRANIVQFTAGSAVVANVANVFGINPNNQTLPISALSIAHSTPPASSATFALSGLALVTGTPPAVKGAAQPATINDPSGVTQDVPCNYTHVAAGIATTVIKASAGILHSIVFNSAAAATNTTVVYDNASGAGTVIAAVAATTATLPTTLIYDLAFNNGLTIITTTAAGGDMTVTWK